MSLRVRRGEIHALVGENGAGKSTLVKILAGAYRLDSGKILIDGKEVRINHPSEGKKSKVAIIYQELSLIPDLSVAENIYLPGLKRKKNMDALERDQYPFSRAGRQAWLSDSPGGKGTGS